jgi:hypothetical protein
MILKETRYTVGVREVLKGKTMGIPDVLQLLCELGSGRRV